MGDLERLRYSSADVPMLFVTAGLISGILVGAYGAATLWCVAAIVTVAVVSLRFGRSRIVIASVAALIGIGVWMINLPTPCQAGLSGGFSGEVVKVDCFGEMQRCVVVIDGEQSRIAVSVYDYPYQIEQGDEVKFIGRLIPAVSEKTVPDEYDGALFAKVNYLSGRCEVAGENFTVISPASGVKGWLNRVRGELLDIIRYNGLSQESSEFLAAILLGRDMSNSEIKETFSSAGLSHVLALSGTHVSTIILLVSVLLFPVEMAGNRRLRGLFVIAVLWGYAMLVGMMPSVVRAVIMATFVAGGNIFGRRSVPLNSLCSAATLILLFDPASLFLPGFQLSFMAVVGILTLLPLMRHTLIDKFAGKSRFLLPLATLFFLPLAAVTATAPLSAWHFHTFPIWFFAANIPVGIVLPIMLCGGVALVLAGCLNFKCELLANIIDGLYRFVETTARFTADLPGNDAASNLYFQGWFVVLIYVGMIVAWTGWNLRRKGVIANGVIILTGSLLLTHAAVRVSTGQEYYPWKIDRGVAIVCREKSAVYIVSDANEKYYASIKQLADFKLSDFMARRDASLMEICGDSLNIPNVCIRGNVWNICGRKFLIVRSESDINMLDAADFDIVVVSAGFRGDILDISRRIGNASLVLSPSLPTVRRKSYADALANNGVNFYFSLSGLLSTE